MKPCPDTPAINLNQHDWDEIKRILSLSVPNYTVWAFGSRVTEKVKPYSDLDIVVITDRPLSLEQMATIKDAFDDSDLPIRVDVVDWATTSASFREIIRRRYVVIQEGMQSEQP